MVRNLVPNSYRVATIVDDHDLGPETKVVLTASRSLTLHPGADQGRVRGTVALDGVPLASAEVDFTSSPGERSFLYTDDNGAFFEDLLPGTWTVAYLGHTDTLTVPAPYWIAPATTTTLSVRSGGDRHRRARPRGARRIGRSNAQGGSGPYRIRAFPHLRPFRRIRS